MAYESNGNTPDPKSQGGSGEGDKTKLYAGKYKTPEEMEAAYKELERGYHDTRQEVSQLRQTIETRIPEPTPQGGDYGRGSGQFAPIPETADQGQAAQVLARFYQNPVAVLREVSAAAAQEAEARVAKRQTEYDNNKTRVQTWLDANKDLKAHGDLLDYHVRQTDGRLKIEDRLNSAAVAVRKRIAELRGAPASADPRPEDFVPGPSGTRDGGEGGSPAPAAPAASAESALAAYANTRNVSRIKRPGTHRG